MPASRLVGEAYVLMRADGRLLKGDMKREGKNSAKGLTEEWDKEFERSAETMRVRFKRSISDAFVGGDFSAFRKEFGSIEATVDGLRAKLKTLTHDSNGMLLPMKDRKLLVKQYEEIIGGLEKWADAELELEAKRRTTIDTNKSLTQMFKNQNAGLVALNKSRLREEESLRRTAAMMDSVGSKVKGATVEIDRHNSSWVRTARSVRIGLDVTADRADHFGTIVGRAFGKGSRNNFLNWVGSMVGGMLRLGTAIVTFPVKVVSHIVDSFGSAFSEARKTMGFFTSAGKGIAAVFGGSAGLVGAVGGFAAGAFALTKVLPTIISLMTLMAGAATALVGSIGIGLTGALLAVTPAAFGALAGLGSVFGAINAFAQDKTNTEFWESVFTKPFEKFNKQFAPKVKTFLTDFRSGFAILLTDLKPGVDRFFDSFDKRFGDTTTVSALGKWSDSIGRIAKSLNDAVTAFGSGLVGFFVPVLPYAERLATWIDTIAIRFDKWANSPKGQNAIADFMHDAWIDAKLVWDILREIGSIIGTVFSSGDETGSSFLTGIRDKLSEIDAFLDTPEGRSKLDNFFGDAKDIGVAIGSIATDIGGLVKDLSSPEGRQGAKDIMGSIKTLADSADDIIRTTTAIAGMVTKVQELIELLNPLTNPLKPLVDIFNFLSGKSGEQDAKPKPPPVAPTQAPNLGLGGTARPVPGATVPTPGATVAGPVIDSTLTINGFRGDNAAVRALTALGLSRDQIVTLAGYVVPVDIDDELYQSTKAIIEQFKFTGKQVPVKGNEEEWNLTKGTIAGYAFKSKVVPIDVNPTKLDNWIAKWNKTNLNKTATIRYAIEGTLPNGGRSLRGGATASGGMFSGAQQRTIGESGREAVVPLDRPLWLVDPSVRALSAIAQGLNPVPQMGAGGIGGGGKGPVNIDLSVTTQATNPYTVGAIVKDELMLALQ